jgi:hypothetical protein
MYNVYVVDDITNERIQQTQRYIQDEDTSWESPKMENPMDDGQRRKTRMIT